MQYRKKPVVIEAVQWDGTNVAEVQGFFKEFLDWVFLAPDGIAISTLEGILRASKGDWIIKGTKGEFYPCKPDIFASIYDPVESPDQQKERHALKREQIESEISALKPFAKDYDTVRQSNDTCLAAGAHDALRWALGLAEESISEVLTRS